MHKRYGDLNERQRQKVAATFTFGNVANGYSYEIGTLDNVLSRRKYRKLDMEDSLKLREAVEGDVLEQFGVMYDLRQVRPATISHLVDHEVRDYLLLRSIATGKLYCVARYYDGEHGAFNLAANAWSWKEDLSRA